MVLSYILFGIKKVWHKKSMRHVKRKYHIIDILKNLHIIEGLILELADKKTN